MKIKIIQTIGNLKEAQEIELEDNFANALLKKGYAKRIQENKEVEKELKEDLTTKELKKNYKTK